MEIMAFAVGDRVETWSMTQSKFIEGTVSELGSGAKTGSVKISYTVGGFQKWIQPDALSQLRVLEQVERPTEPKPIEPGQSIDVWSRTMDKWVEAKVSEVTSDDGIRRKGSFKVNYNSGGFEKWISPTDLSEVRVHPSSGPEEVPEPIKTGDKIQVWSKTQAEWVDATVAEFGSEGSIRRKGSMKVSYAAGGFQKWIDPAEITESVRADAALVNP